MIALSYSRLSTFEQCPAKFKAQYIDKTYPSEDDKPVFVRGKKIHSQCDKYIKHKTKGLVKPAMSPEASNAIPIIDTVIGKYDIVRGEQKLALNTNFKKCDWFDKSVIYRAILDMVAVKDKEALIIDFKTGKVRQYDNKPTGQLHLSSTFIFTIFPKIDIITTAYLFLDHKQTITKTFNRDSYEKSVKVFKDLFKEVNIEKEWLPKKNKYCHWCLVNDCKFNSSDLPF